MGIKGVLYVVFVLWICVVSIFAAEIEIEIGSGDAGLHITNSTALNDRNGSDPNLSKHRSHLGSGTDGHEKDVMGDNINATKDSIKSGSSGGTRDAGDKEGAGINKDSNKVPSAGGKKEDLGEVKPRKENSGADECDASHSCVDEKNKLIACLRIPGNDSPDLSLLVQNKGTEPLTIDIKGPQYIQLETRTVLLQKEESKKVRVSFGNANNDTRILLTASDSHCNLDFRDFIFLRHSGHRNVLQEKSMLNGVLRAAGLVLVVIVLLCGVVWASIRLQRRLGPRYEKVDVELPVSIVGKSESDWNVGWEDDWDDEAPKTPSKPISNLSSKGLATRKFNKDGGKDH